MRTLSKMLALPGMALLLSSAPVLPVSAQNAQTSPNALGNSAYSEPPSAPQPPAANAVDSAPQARLMARRAAIADAQRQLSEMIYGTELDSYTEVRDFVTERDEIRTQIRALLRGAEVTDTRYLVDGTVEVDMEVPVHRVAHVIGRNFAYPGDAFRATGAGVPNPVRETGRQPVIPPSEAPYDYRLLTISATGSGAVPPEKIGTAQGFAMAKRAAQLDGYRQLGENVMGVRVSSDTYVRDFITESDEIRTSFQGFLRGATITEVRQLPDGIVEVDMQVALSPLGEMIPVPNAQPARTVRATGTGMNAAPGSSAPAPRATTAPVNAPAQAPPEPGYRNETPSDY